MCRIRSFLAWVVLLGLIVSSYSSFAETKDKNTIDVGDEIIFGHFIQDVNGQEQSPIEWIVLDKNKNRLTIISKKILETLPFHNNDTGAYWPQSSLRKWLNEDFYQTAFSKDEQKAITTTKHNVSTYDVSDFELKSRSQSTNDKVFLLSVSEALEYFCSDKQDKEILGYFGIGGRSNKPYNNDTTNGFYRAEVTPYAYREKMSYNMTPIGQKIIEEWWLRDSCRDKGYAVNTGKTDPRFYVDDDKVQKKYGVRPAVIIDLNSIKDGLLQINENKENEFFSIPETNKDNSIMLGFNIHFERNMLFSKYDVSLYVDNKHIYDLEHGKSETITSRIAKGKHTVYFYKKDDHSIMAKEEVDIKEHSYFECSISTNRKTVEVKDLAIVSRYNISDPTSLSSLKEYDAIVDQLYREYDIGLYRRVNGRRTDYEEMFLLLNSKTNSVIFCLRPKTISNDNPVAFDTGYYTGSLASGEISVILQGGKTYNWTVSEPKDENMRLKNFYSICEDFIHYLYPHIHDNYSIAINYLLFNEREQYNRIMD